MNTFGLRELIKVKRENFSGWERENQSPIKIGMQENQTTFSKFKHAVLKEMLTNFDPGMRTANKSTVWKCGIGTEKVWVGTTPLAVSLPFSSVKLD